MRWPFWFPYPGAYAHCLLMLMLNSFNAALLSPVVWVIFVVGGAASIAAEAFAGNATLSALLVFGVILAITFLALLLLAYEYQVMDCFGRWVRREERRPKVLAIPPAKYWRDAVFGYLVFGGSVLVIFLSWTIWRCYAGYCQEKLVEEEQYIIAASSLILMILCYHVRIVRNEWLERWRKRRNVKSNQTKLPKVKRPSKSPKHSRSKQPGAMAKQQPLSVDEELELLKRQVERDKKNQP